MLDHGLLVLVKLLLRDVNRGDTNIRIVRLQQRVLQLAVAIDFHLLLRYCAVFVDLQRDYAKDTGSVHNGHLRISFVLSVGLQPERETSRSLSACSGWNVFLGLPLPRLKRAGSGL